MSKPMRPEEWDMWQAVHQAISTSPIACAHIADGTRVYGCIVFSGDDYQVEVGEHGNTFIHGAAVARYLRRNRVPPEHVRPIVEPAESEAQP